jgi:methyl-accepting chemotaxis protein
VRHLLIDTMKSLKSMLALLVGAGMLAGALLTAVSLVETGTADRATQRALVAKDVTADILPPPLYLIELRLVLSQAVEGSLPLPRARAEAARLEKEYRERIAHWAEHPPYGLERALLGPQHEEAQRFLQAAAPVLASVADGDPAAARAALEAAHARYEAHRQGVDATVRTAGDFATQAIGSLEEAQRTARWVQLLVFGISAALLAGLGWWVRRGVWAATGGEPAQAAAVAHAVARGDLSLRVPVAPGDRGSVMAALAHMCERLSHTVGQVRAGSEHIAAGTRQIALGNQDLSDRTESQASALEQTAAAMEQMTSTVAQNAQHAADASRLARDASGIARRSGEEVSEMVGTIQDIDRSSRRIADIIGTIDGIAFQTNILALNAAVEAARAGEQGRGFAMVAGEVRSLARRSADAAKEIRTLIDDSVRQVGHGVALAGRTGGTMDAVVEAIERVSGIVEAISAASGEQRTGASQIGEAIHQLDRNTQQNAALVEESAAAARSLHQQAESLAEAVAVFRMQGPGRGGPPHLPAPSGVH